MFCFLLVFLSDPLNFFCLNKPVTYLQVSIYHYSIFYYTHFLLSHLLSSLSILVGYCHFYHSVETEEWYIINAKTTIFDYLSATELKSTEGSLWISVWEKEKPQVILGPARFKNHCPSSFIFKLNKRPGN